MEGHAATSQGAALQFEVALVDASAEREDKTQGALYMFVLTGCVKRRRTTTRNSLDRRDRRCTRKEIPMKFCSLGARLS